MYGDHLVLIYSCVTEHHQFVKSELVEEMQSLSPGPWVPWALFLCSQGNGALPSPALATFGPPHQTQVFVKLFNCAVEKVAAGTSEDEWDFAWCCLALLKASHLNCCSVSGLYTVIFNNLIYLGCIVFIQSLRFQLIQIRSYNCIATVIMAVLACADFNCVFFNTILRHCSDLFYFHVFFHDTCRKFWHLDHCAYFC